MIDLGGQVAIVTGAGSGIGSACARVLADDGAAVAVVDINSDSAQQTSSLIAANGGDSTPYGVDVSDGTQVERLVETVAGRAGRIDVLVCNVGVYPTALIENTDDALWERVMRTNATSAFVAIRAVAPIMRGQGYGRIVLTSSVTGPMSAIAGLAHYGASKGALGGLMRGAAVELAAFGVTVNAVLPGTVRTEGVKSSGGTDFVDQMLPSIPMGRPATPEDIAWAIRWLAAPEASYITGVELVVDGGQRLAEGGRLAPLSHTYEPLPSG